MKKKIIGILCMVVVCVVAFSLFNNEEKEKNDYVPPVVGESHSESGLNFYIYPSEDYVDQLHNEGYTDEEIEKIWDSAKPNNKSEKELFNSKE